MKSILLYFKIICTAFLFISCHSPSITFPEGGYPYPETISQSDSTFYFVPLRDSLSKRDSILYANGFRLYRAFDEPNLSLQPADSVTFRYLFSLALGNPYLIKLVGHVMTIKEIDSGKSIPSADETRLTDIERIHFRFLERRYPVGDREYKPKWRQYIDSMIKRYPELLSPVYYMHLYDKMYMGRPQERIYHFCTKILPDWQYQKFIQLLDNSGYWKMHYSVDCAEPPMDGWGFTLEANTGRRYNSVSAGSCGVADSAAVLKKACQWLIDCSGLKMEFRVSPAER